MNYYLLISGVLTIFMGIAHSIIGEALILRPLQKTDGLPAVRGSVRATKSTLRFTWHVTSVFGFGSSIILLYYCSRQEFSADQIFVLRILSLTNFVSFLVAIIGSGGRHLSWLVFIFVSVLTWLGTIH
jgi:hypothetical protein